MEVIGLAGPARSGKDTVADILEEITPGRVDREAFADRLKLVAALSLGVSVHPDDVGVSGIRRWADRFKEAESLAIIGPGGTVLSEISGREFLQRLGAEAIRGVLGDDTFVEAISFEREADLLVLTDVRYPNEAEAIRRNGGEVWRVTRPGVSRANGHSSEDPLPEDLVDREVVNDGAIADLYDRVRKIRSA